MPIRSLMSGRFDLVGHAAVDSGSGADLGHRPHLREVRRNAGDRARGGGRPGRVPARRVPQPGRARRLPRAPRRARSTTRRIAGLLERLLGDDALRADWRRAPCTRNGHHAYLGGLLEHTVAVGRSRSSPARCTRAELRPAGHRGARARPRQDPRVHLRRRDRAVGEGRLLGHVVLGQRLLDERAAALDEPSGGWRSPTASSATTGRRAAPGGRFGSPEALALYRLNALDASVKGALEHGLAPSN